MKNLVYFNGYGKQEQNNYVYFREIKPIITTDINPIYKSDFTFYENEDINYLNIDLKENQIVGFNILNLSFDKQFIYVGDNKISIQPKVWTRIVVLNKDTYFTINKSEQIIKDKKENDNGLTIKIKGFPFIVFGINMGTDFCLSEDNQIVSTFNNMFGPIITPNRNGVNKTNTSLNLIGQNNNSNILYLKDGFNIKMNNYNILNIIGYRIFVKDEWKYFTGFSKIEAYNNNIITNKPQKKGSINFYAYKNNRIIDNHNPINEYCIFLENNYIKNPELSVTKPFYIYADKGTFNIDTKITQETKEGDNYIVVENVYGALKGNLIGFMTKNKAFVYRKIYSVVDNKIYFQEPLKKGEDTFIDGRVFSNTPKEQEKFETEIVSDTKKYERRFYIKDIPEFSLHLRDVTIGDFKSKINYIDEPTHLLITNDISEHKTSKGEKVKVEEYRFINPVTFYIGQYIPNIFVGQKITIENKSYTVKGFNGDSKKILFKETDENFAGKEAVTEKVPQKYLQQQDSFEVIPIHFKKYDRYVKIASTKEIDTNNQFYISEWNKPLYIKELKKTNSLREGDTDNPISDSNIKKYPFFYEMVFYKNSVDTIIKDKIIIGGTTMDIKEDALCKKELLETEKMFKEIVKK